MRPIINDVQKIPPFVPGIAAPQRASSYIDKASLPEDDAAKARLKELELLMAQRPHRPW